jgi:hypothetical protein
LIESSTAQSGTSSYSFMMLIDAKTCKKVPIQKKKKGEGAPIHNVKVCGRNRVRAPPILNLDSRWIWVFKFIPQPSYPRVPSGWAPEPFWTCCRREKYLSLNGTRTMDCPSRLHYSGCHSFWVRVMKQTTAGQLHIWRHC